MVAIVLGGYSLFQMRAAAGAAQRGRAALVREEGAAAARSLDVARRNLVQAEEAFGQAQDEIAALGPVASVARVIPVVGNQMRAVDTLARAGMSLSRAGQPLVDAADTLLHPADQATPVSAAMDALRSTQATLAPALVALSEASDDVLRLKGAFLVGPVARARDDLVTRLPRIRARAVSAGDGLAALMAFAGESGPKRYLFLSQNPDEIRPTGGFIGTYGVLTAEDGKLALERYDAIEEWNKDHPAATAPAEEAGSPFRLHNPPLPRRLSNVNSTPDWPQAAQLAANLWRAAGEAPVDGVISFTPGFLRRVLGVVGPVEVPGYGERISAANMNERLDFYTHELAPPPGTNRKDFVAALAEVVMQKLLEAPASKWEPLGQAMGDAFDARDALAWSTDPLVARVLADRAWDGAFPSHRGDFFYSSEFAYATKNGRGIRRVFDHLVELRTDGGARVTTEITITNTEAPNPAYNNSTLAYLTIYGPEGATLDQAASEPLGFPEPTMAGHPDTGWFKAAAPAGGPVTLTVVWDVANLLERQKGRAWDYNLRWMGAPDHTGDVVKLRVDLPDGWRWDGAGPPAEMSLDNEIDGTWRLVQG
ncbi:MAG: DUF4012 domain-containing protein [Acidimicrobiales bacterium]